MMTIVEAYRAKLRGPEGDMIIEDLTRYVQRLPQPDRGGAALVLVRIQQMLVMREKPQPVRVGGITASGGRIPHG